MRETDKDIRIIKTKEFIREAFIELIEEKGFEAITVKDITTRARINRGTFYSHYQDKYDLMAKYQEEILAKMKNVVSQNLASVIMNQDSNIPQAAPLNILVSFFEYLDLNRKFMKTLFKADVNFQTKMKAFLWTTLFVNKEFPLIKQENMLVPSEYLIAYVASAHIGVIEQWLNGDGKESPEEMARILSTITLQGPFTAAGLKK